MKNKQPVTVAVPTAEEIPALTDRLAEIEHELNRLTEEKKDIQTRLEAFALQQTPEPLKDQQREGRRVPLAGRRHRATVTFSSDLLIGSFKLDSPKHKELLRVLAPLTHETELTAESLLLKFFEAPNTYTSRFKDGQAFRKAAGEWLGDAVAPAFITACRSVDKFGIAKSKTVFDVDYKATEEGAGHEA